MADHELDLSRAVELLERITRYAREDRARTPGTTRLARVLTETEAFLSSIRAEAAAEPGITITPVEVKPWQREALCVGSAKLPPLEQPPLPTRAAQYPGEWLDADCNDLSKPISRAEPESVSERIDEAHAATLEKWDAEAEALRVSSLQQPPLRTRAEVDAEIAGLVRGANRLGNGNEIRSQLYGEKLARLCDEPTTPRAELTGEERAVLWDAINDVVAASGGNPGNTSVARQKAVVQVEKFVAELAIERAARAPAQTPVLPAGWVRVGHVIHNPEENPEKAFNVRWFGAHHDGLYVEGYDFAVVVPRAVILSLMGAPAQTAEPCPRCKWADGCQRAEEAESLVKDAAELLGNTSGNGWSAKRWEWLARVPDALMPSKVDAEPEKAE